MTATKTTTKPVVKTTNKAPAKTKAAPKTAFYATVLADALMGKYGNQLQRFYVNACSYHLKAKTVFPRVRLAGVELLNEKDTVEFLKKHEGTSIPAGSKTGQRLFDEMMVQTAAKK